MFADSIAIFVQVTARTSAALQDCRAGWGASDPPPSRARINTCMRRSRNTRGIGACSGSADRSPQ